MPVKRTDNNFYPSVVGVHLRCGRLVKIAVWGIGPLYFLSQQGGKKAYTAILKLMKLDQKANNVPCYIEA